MIEREAPFVVTRPMHLVLGVDEPFPADLQTTCREFCDRTYDYWINWVRGLSISYDWQDEIIRAAITLKLSTFEETGGIIAAHTTSIPEAANSGRTWDYRYCWLRDAYFVVKALNRIGATQTMEDFISFILSVASNRNEPLRPVHNVGHTEPLDERTAPALMGYRGDGPVRVGNAAAGQDQNDTYGSAILAAMPMFYDRRLPRLGDEGLFHLLETLGEKAAKLALQPDNGIWEYRGRRRIHTHSVAMCWAGCQRLAAIATRLGFAERAEYWQGIANPIHEALLGGVERETPGFYRRLRIGRSRRQRPVATRSRRDRERRSAIPEHRQGDGARTFAREARYAICGGRRLWPAGNGVLDLPILAGRCMVVARPARGGA